MRFSSSKCFCCRGFAVLHWGSLQRASIPRRWANGGQSSDRKARGVEPRFLKVGIQAGVRLSSVLFGLKLTLLPLSSEHEVISAVCRGLYGAETDDGFRKP